MRLLASRTAKLLGKVQEGNYNPYSKEEAQSDARLKDTIGKYFEKMAALEKRKYLKPNLSESLQEMAILAGWTGTATETDALSKGSSLGDTNPDGDADQKSLFSKYTVSKRPTGFFAGPGEKRNDHSGEISVERTGKAFYNEKHEPQRGRGDSTQKSD